MLDFVRQSLYNYKGVHTFSTMVANYLSNIIFSLEEFLKKWKEEALQPTSKSICSSDISILSIILDFCFFMKVTITNSLGLGG